MSRDTTHPTYGSYEHQHPADTRTLLGTAALAALLPLVVWAVSYPRQAALAALALLALGLAVRTLLRVAGALADREAAYRVPGLDLTVALDRR